MQRKGNQNQPAELGRESGPNIRPENNSSPTSAQSAIPSIAAFATSQEESQTVETIRIYEAPVAVSERAACIWPVVGVRGRSHLKPDLLGAKC